jgi:hypothetical protein
MRLKAIPHKDGSWTIKGTADYSKVVREAGYGAAPEALQAAGIIPEGAAEGIAKVSWSGCP